MASEVGRVVDSSGGSGSSSSAVGSRRPRRFSLHPRPPLPAAGDADSLRSIGPASRHAYACSFRVSVLPLSSTSMSTSSVGLPRSSASPPSDGSTSSSPGPSPAASGVGTPGRPSGSRARAPAHSIRQSHGDLEAIPLAGEGGLFPPTTLAGRCLAHFNCGLSELRLLFMVLPCAAVFLFVLHQVVAGLLLSLLTFLLLVVVAYRLVALLRQRNLLAYQQLQQQDASGISLAGLGGGGLHGLRYAQLLAASARNNPTAVRLAMLDRDFTPNDYETLLALDDESRAQTFNGLHRSAIERLPTYAVPPSNPGVGKSPTSKVDTCSVCLEPKLEGEMVRALQCLHSFHVQCIDPWLKDHRNCPIDRLPVLDPLESNAFPSQAV